LTNEKRPNNREEYQLMVYLVIIGDIRAKAQGFSKADRGQASFCGAAYAVRDEELQREGI
jgi:hypothetical protein